MDPKKTGERGRWFEENIVPRIEQILDECREHGIGMLVEVEWPLENPVGELTHYRGYHIKAYAGDHPMLAQRFGQLRQQAAENDAAAPPPNQTVQ